MSEQSKGFTVNDRRHFTADGSPREAGKEKPTSVPGSDAEAVRPSPLPASADFGSFLLSLAGQASALLGLAAEGEKQPNVDLEGARHIISVLEMLKDKSEGRRSAEEDRLIEGLLYELRIAWVSRSRAGVA